MTIADQVRSSNPAERILGVGRYADMMRLMYGQKYEAVVDGIQRMFAREGMPVPDVATVDAWLEECDV